MHRIGYIYFAAILLAYFACGCGDGGTEEAKEDAGSTDDTDTVDPDSDDTDTVTDDGSDPFPYRMATEKVTWFPCSLHEGEDDGLAECAATPMPRYWDDDTDKTIEIYAKRLLAPGQASAQLWLLHGGPGASGVILFPSWMEMFREHMPDVDIYTLDHRGTGYSSRLACPEQENDESPSGAAVDLTEIDDCFAHLDETLGDWQNSVTTTFSAIDVGAYIQLTREKGKKVILWGGSYGSYWAHRYLQVFPDQADGVSIAGIAPPDISFLTFSVPSSPMYFTTIPTTALSRRSSIV